MLGGVGFVANAVMAPMSLLKPSTPRERDIGSDADAELASSSGGGVIRRSFSFGKKKKAPTPVANPLELDIDYSVRTAVIRSAYAFEDVGFALHVQAGWIVVSHLGLPPGLAGTTTVGDGLVALQGVDFPQGEASESDLEYARGLLREASERREEIILTLQTIRRVEVLQRQAALRGTSLDKLGLTLEETHAPWAGCANRYVVEINDVIANGLAAKSGRFALGDKVTAINAARVNGLQSALELLDWTKEAELLEFELVAGFCPPEGHAFDKATGVFQPPPPADVAMEAAEWLDADREMDCTMRKVKVMKDKRGRLGIELMPHEVTGELIISLIGSGTPAARANLEVGDQVLEINGYNFESAGVDETVLGADARAERSDAARSGMALMNRVKRALDAWDEACSLKVITSLRTEVLSFGARDLGGPKDVLGLDLHAFEEDKAIRVTDVFGPALKSGRVALGDRVTRIGGTRVWNANAAHALIAHACRRGDTVEVEFALGHAPAKGLWYGAEHEDAQGGGDTPKQVKRSFSFGRKPKH